MGRGFQSSAYDLHSDSMTVSQNQTTMPSALISEKFAIISIIIVVCL